MYQQGFDNNSPSLWKLMERKLEHGPQVWELGSKCQGSLQPQIVSHTKAKIMRITGNGTANECTTIQIKHATHLSLKGTVIRASIQYA